MFVSETAQVELKSGRVQAPAVGGGEEGGGQSGDFDDGFRARHDIDRAGGGPLVTDVVCDGVLVPGAYTRPPVSSTSALLVGQGIFRGCLGVKGIC